MSRTRFGLLLALVAVLIAGGAFLLGLRVLDDDQPDSPPRVATAGTEGDAGATTSSSTSTTAPGGELTTPAWIVIISSEGDEGRAGEVAAQVAADGHDAGVLRSDDYPSMNPGYWVAYAGPYPDAAAARAGEAAVEGDGWTAAYVRCAGTTEQCGGGGGEDDDGDDD